MAEFVSAAWLTWSESSKPRLPTDFQTLPDESRT